MAKKLTLLTILLALVISLTACAPKASAPAAAPTASSAEAIKAEYHQLTAAQAKARMDSGDEVIILDVRTPEEYAQGHIPGAVLLPVTSIGSDTAKLLPDKDAEILIYCRSGNRSRQATNMLVDMGYTAVYDFGGINSWPYEVVTE